MGMAVGPSGGQSANINVTPLIDVLLVLLIIFMVINPRHLRVWMRWFRSRLRPTRPRTIRLTALSWCS